MYASNEGEGRDATVFIGRRGGCTRDGTLIDGIRDIRGRGGGTEDVATASLPLVEAMEICLDSVCEGGKKDKSAEVDRSRLRLGDDGAKRLHVDRGRKAFFFSIRRDESVVSVCEFTEVGASFAAKLDLSGRIFKGEIFEGCLLELVDDMSISSVGFTGSLLLIAWSCLLSFSAELRSREMLELCSCGSPDDGRSTQLS